MKGLEITILRKRIGIILPLAVIVTLFLIYSRFQESTIINPEILQVLERLAIGFYVILSASIVALAVGLYSYHKKWAQKNIKIIKN